VSLPLSLTISFSEANSKTNRQKEREKETQFLFQLKHSTQKQSSISLQKITPQRKQTETTAKKKSSPQLPLFRPSSSPRRSISPPSSTASFARYKKQETLNFIAFFLL